MEPTYKSGRALAIATVVPLVVMTVLMLAQLILVQLTMLEGGAFDTGDAATRVMILRLIVAATQLAHLATIVLFATWVYRATSNLPALGSLSIPFTPARAVWAFFIPIVNLLWSYQVMAMIWKESQPRAITSDGALKPRSLALVTVWYLLWMASIAGACIESVLADLWPHVTAKTVSLSLVVNSAAALACAIMVYVADARQRAQVDDLERRASLPQPTGRELR